MTSCLRTAPVRGGLCASLAYSAALTPPPHPAGLVFPSFIHSREEMVVSGILPIDQLRDHTSPMRLLCQRIPRPVLEAVYGFTLPVPEPGSGRRSAALRQPTPTELLDAYCRMRGFTAAVHSGYDHPRGARILLKDYCEGKVVFCHPPPGPLGWAIAEAGASFSAPRPGPGARSGGGGRVSLDDNVLLPSVQGRHSAAAGGGEGGGAQAAGAAAAAAASVAAVAVAPVAAAAAAVAAVATASAAAISVPVDSSDEDEGGDDGASSSGSSLGDDDLLAFSRVVVVQRPPPGAEVEGGDGSSEEEEEEGGGVEDDEGSSSDAEGEDAEESSDEGKAIGGSGSAPAPAPSVGGGGSTAGKFALRQPRVRGLGRHGSRKKGEREADPYGTARAADAAMRGSVLAEIAAVSAGPAAAAAAAAAAPDATRGAAAAGGAGAAAARVLPAAGLPQREGARVRKDVGGARVLDAVPSVVRGQRSAINMAPSRVNFPAHLLDAAIRLQDERTQRQG